MERGTDLFYFFNHPDFCRKEAEALQRNIAWKTMTNRGMGGFTQYGIYFGGMWAYSVFGRESARIIRSGNFYWRWIDDIADGDRVLPNRYTSKEEFLQDKRVLVNKLFSDLHVGFGDREDLLLLDYFLISKRLGISLEQESKDILGTLIWDEERARNRRILAQDELDQGLIKLDSACVNGAFKVGREPYTSKDLEQLSFAVRTMFNLRDFPKDFAQGIINISLEDIENYGIDLDQLNGRTSIGQLVAYDPMRRWYKDQVDIGLDNLRASKSLMKGMNLRWITRLAIGINFIRPTDKTLTGYARMLGG